MHFYEVFLELVNHGRDVGRTCIQLSATSPFSASMEAERIVNERYGLNIFSHTLRVSPITEDEFLYQLAA